MNQSMERFSRRVSDEDNSEIDILELLQVLGRKIVWIVLAAVVFGAAAFCFSKFCVMPVYRSRFTAYVNNRSVGSEDTSTLSYSDLSAAQSLVNTYAEIIVSSAVLNAAAEDAGLKMEYSNLVKLVETEIASGTEIITVYVKAYDPVMAQSFAIAIAQQAQMQITNIVDGTSMRIIDQPTAPTTIYSPRYSLVTIIAAFLGALFSGVFFLVREWRDDLVKDERLITHKYELPIIGVVPNFQTANAEKTRYGGAYALSSKHKRGNKEMKKAAEAAVLAKAPRSSGTGKKGVNFSFSGDAPANGQFMLLQPSSPFSIKEAYNALRTKVIFSFPGAGCKVIGFTSTGRREGKSSNAVNLAIAFSELDKKVLLIDGDMRLPTVATKLGLKLMPGLSDFLVGQAKGEKCIRGTAYANLDVIPAGNIPPNPTRLLQSPAMGELIEMARSRYDYVIIDLPPINTVTDAAILSEYVDGYLLIVRHNQTEFKQVDIMLSDMQMANAHLLGFLYNDVPVEKKGYYKKHGYGKNYGYSKDYDYDTYG